MPAAAQTIPPNDAQQHVSQQITVEGVVSDVHTAASGKATFIDIGGHYPENTFTGVIFSDEMSKFPNVDSLKGKVVDITGRVSLYRGRPEIILNRGLC